MGSAFTVLALALAVGWLGDGSGTLAAGELPAVRHATVVIAHRGEHYHHQENTVEAIDAAVAAGADFTEMDVRRTRDGRYVLMHDATVDRMTQGHGRVADLTWAELSVLVVSDRRLSGVVPSRIPLFEEALRTCRGRIFIYLDFKAGDRREVAALVKAAEMERQVMVYDGAEGIVEWRSVAPELAVMTSLTKEATRNQVGFREFVAKYRPQAVDDLPVPSVFPIAEELGLKVWPDIQRPQEDPKYWETIWKQGVRGFQTDHPAELVRWLESTNRR
jgi:glycerophosphoryl diester phosphodiesterase